jgi:hypothetical protein
VFSRKDNRKLNNLREEGYLSPKNPLTPQVLTALYSAGEPRPEWVDAFLNDACDASEPEAPEVTYHAEDDMLEDAQFSVFALFGRDIMPRQLAARDTKVIRQWLKLGLDAKTTEVARACDVAHQFASDIRQRWGDEIRALTQEAGCLGVTGEDLFMHSDPTLPPPMRLIERLKELRVARGNKGGMLRKEFETWLKSQWDAYKRRYPGKWDQVHPPSWFVQQIT